MSKNIIIQEDGVATNLTVDKLRTAKYGGGTVDWIPEENLNVSNLKVHQNGTYTAQSMNVFGFDVVKVAIDNHGGAGASLDGSPHGGELVAHDVSIKEGEQGRTIGGTKRLKLNKQGGGIQLFIADTDVETGALSVTREGIFRARSDGKYAYTSVTVNVQSGGGGGGGGEDDPYAPENLPKYIAGSPLCIEYVDGDIIPVQDGDIKAYKEVYAHEGRNTLWTSPDYPNGGIPVSELTINPTVAVYDESIAEGGYDEYTIDTSVLYDPNSITQPVNVINVITEKVNNPVQTITYTPYGNAYLLLLDDGRVTTPVAIATSPGSGYREKCVNKTDPSRSYDVIRAVNSIGYTTRVSNTPFGIIYGSSADKSYAGRVRIGVETHVSTQRDSYEFNRDLATIIIDGDKTEIQVHSQQIITVSWPRPVDGQVLTGSFYILVYPSGTDLGGGEVISEGGTGTT